MNDTTNAGVPSYNTGDTESNKAGVAYDVGFSFLVIFLVFTILYTYFVCKRNSDSRSSQQPAIISFRTTIDSDTDDDQCTKPSSGLDDGILLALPTLHYSEAVKRPQDHNISYGLGCSICLADYKPTDVIRLLPTCGHLFHVSCVDTWLKVHPTCPVCRKSPIPMPASELT
jgi:hypothetical protein